jgi:IS5 family transposase
VVDKKTGKIICTEFFNGKAHDGTIFKTTLSILKRILVLADSGYRGVQKFHANTKFPLRHREDFGLMTDSERKAYNKSISSPRMKVEHIIGSTKRFRIARERYRNRRKRFGLRYNLICGIVNYENRA